MVTIGKEQFICNDIDDIKVDGQWQKVSLFLKKGPKTKDVVTIEKAPKDREINRFHKLLKPAFDTRLKFSKVYIATDADPDGSAINNLLINLFHEYFPELFWDKENPFINRITFPMIAATKGKKTLYYENRQVFEKAKELGKVDDSWKITYFKGLGSMEKEDWEHVFDNLDEYSFKIVDDGHLDELMQIFFDADASIRKEWLATK
jgi:DNA gyrase/topoisomerase IV subunit B